MIKWSNSIWSLRREVDVGNILKLVGIKCSLGPEAWGLKPEKLVNFLIPEVVLEFILFWTFGCMVGCRATSLIVNQTATIETKTAEFTFKFVFFFIYHLLNGINSLEKT